MEAVHSEEVFPGAVLTPCIRNNHSFRFHLPWDSLSVSKKIQVAIAPGLVEVLVLLGVGMLQRFRGLRSVEVWGLIPSACSSSA